MKCLYPHFYRNFTAYGLFSLLNLHYGQATAFNDKDSRKDTKWILIFDETNFLTRAVYWKQNLTNQRLLIPGSSVMIHHTQSIGKVPPPQTTCRLDNFRVYSIIQVMRIQPRIQVKYRDTRYSIRYANIRIIYRRAMEKLLFNVDPGSIGVMAENEEGVETYLPVLMFNYKITG